MANLVGKSPRDPSDGANHARSADRDAAPGKHTQVEQAYAPVQRAAARPGASSLAPSGAGDATAVQAAAARGVATPASPLPFGETIQRAFGRHDVSSIQAHTGGDAAASTRAMGADAYATGNHVVLGKGSDLFTVAHEAAHVVQQRGGVQLKGGVGEAGDPHERHADEVAAQVVAGGSAEPLLDRYAGDAGGGAGPTPVQRRIHLANPPPGRTIEGPTGAGSDAYHFLAEVNARIDALHFTRTNVAQRQVQDWVRANQLENFADVDAVVNRLFDDGLLQRTVRGAQMGPRQLGNRPTFTGAAASMPIGPGEHRRHVLSSSTLGRAIERANALPADVNRFLQAHGGTPVHGTQSIDRRNAQRNAWVLVHNHVGNLWAGPGPANSMIGFIRSPLIARADALDARQEPQIPRADPGLAMPLPQGATRGSPEEAHWNYVTQIASEMLDESAPGGQVDPHEAAAILREISANCDLDLPPGRDGDYFTRAHAIYLELITNPHTAFVAGGPLDRFMALDHRGHPAGAAMNTGGGSDAGGDAAMDTDTDSGSDGGSAMDTD